jgi:hypothetical protein
MSDQDEPNGFVLPIICNHCGKQIELSMEFNLLPINGETEESEE